MSKEIIRYTSNRCSQSSWFKCCALRSWFMYCL